MVAESFGDIFRKVAPWCSGLTRLPVKEEIGSSNLLGVATLLLNLTVTIIPIVAPV